MKQLFKGQISFQAVFSKCAQARYYHGILAATGSRVSGAYMQWFVRCMDIRPAENFCVAMLQTPLRFLGQNLFGDQFWSWSEAGKVCPQAILGPGAKGLTGGLPLDLKLTGDTLSRPLITPKIGLQSDFGLRIWVEFVAWPRKNFRQA